MQNEQIAKAQPNIVPLSRYNDYYDFPKVGALRQMVFHNTKGFKDAVIKYVGNRQYISVEALELWISKTNCPA